MNVLNWSALKGKVPPNAYYIGRNPKIAALFNQGQPWIGNPFIIGRDGTRDEVCEKFEAWFEKKLQDPKFRERVLTELSGKDLVCHCAPERCHGHSIRNALDRLLGKQTGRAAAAAAPEARLESALKTAINHEFGKTPDAPGAAEPASAERLATTSFAHRYSAEPQNDPYMKSGAVDAMGRAFSKAFGEVWGRLDADVRNQRRAALHIGLRAYLHMAGNETALNAAALTLATTQYLLAANITRDPASDAKFQAAMRDGLIEAKRHHEQMLRQSPGLAREAAEAETARPAPAPTRPAPQPEKASASWNRTVRDMYGTTDAPPAAAQAEGTHVAIIGTAGRRDDGKRITRPLYEKMLENARETVRKLGGKDEVILVSGGAAVADHLAVRLFLEGEAKGLKLFLPAEFQGFRSGPDPDGRPNGRFAENPRDRMSPGNITNYYHRQFRQATGVDGLAEIAQALKTPGCLAVVEPGFKERNTLVANISDVVIAYTFGPGQTITTVSKGERGHADPDAAGLKDGGTADTWRKATKAAQKIHVPLGLLEREAGARARTEARASQKRGFER